MDTKTAVSIVIDKGIKQSFIATKLGVTQSTVRAWKKGWNNMDVSYRSLFKEYFGVEINAENNS